MINVKKDLRDWLVDHITDSIHAIKVVGKPNPEFENWAKNFKREEAAFLVDMEFVVDWGYEERESITEEEAKEYAGALMKRIVDVWYL